MDGTAKVAGLLKWTNDQITDLSKHTSDNDWDSGRYIKVYDEATSRVREAFDLNEAESIVEKMMPEPQYLWGSIDARTRTGVQVINKLSGLKAICEKKLPRRPRGGRTLDTRLRKFVADEKAANKEITYFQIAVKWKRQNTAERKTATEIERAIQYKLAYSRKKENGKDKIAAQKSVRKTRRKRAAK